MNAQEKEAILQRAQDWFRQSVAESHAARTRSLVDAAKFNINPFITSYLANFLEGNGKPESMAKALIYPRALGTSIVTIFGTGIQKFTNEVLGSFGSMISGIDLEFHDHVDLRKKFCQLKSGPNTINNDDVETINQHFDEARRRARINQLSVRQSDLMVGVIYGTEDQLSNHYKRLTNQYHIPIHIGEDFWHRLTGDPEFYFDLIESIGKVAVEANFVEEFGEVIKALAETEEIREISDLD